MTNKSGSGRLKGRYDLRRLRLAAQRAVSKTDPRTKHHALSVDIFAEAPSGALFFTAPLPVHFPVR